MVKTLFRTDDLKFQCYQCNTDLRNQSWDSEFDEDRHYKSMTCNCCGKHHHVKVNFLGSGHDSWDGTQHWKKHVNWKHKEDTCKVKTIKNLVQLIKEK